MALDSMQLGGVEASSTRYTRGWNIWSEAVELAAIAHGAKADWLREPAQRQRMSQAYAAGEAVWMVADEMIQRAKGAVIAAREDSDQRAIRRAVLRG